MTGFIKCMDGKVANGEITEDQANESIDLFNKHMDFLREKGIDPTEAEAMASMRASEEYVRKVQLKKIQKQKSIEAAAKFRDDLQQSGRPAYEVLVDFIEQTGKSGIVSADKRTLYWKGLFQGMFENAIFRYRPRWYSAGRYRKLDNIDNVVRELFGINTGDQDAAAMAKSWQEVSSKMRDTAINLGGDIPWRSDWAFPQKHSQLKMLNAVKGKGQRQAAKQKWVDDVMSRLDWDGMYMKDENGFNVPVPEASRREVLEGVYDAVTTDGNITLQADVKFTTKKALANNITDARFLKFKSAEDIIWYQKQYGDGTPFDVMIHHIDYMSKTIAQLERFGPNPETFKEYMKLYAKKEAATIEASGESGRNKILEKANRATEFFDEVFGAMRGQTNGSDSGIARGFRFTRNLITSAFLGGVGPLAFATDMTSSMVTASFNGMPRTKFIKQYFKLIGSQMTRREAVRMGLIAESATSMLADQVRYFGDYVGSPILSAVNDTMFRITGNTAHTQIANWAWGMSMMNWLSDIGTKSFDELPAKVKSMFERYEITHTDWDNMRSAPKYSFDGQDFLRPDNIFQHPDLMPEAATEINQKFMNMIMSERDFAIQKSSLKARSSFIGNTRAGTIVGETARSASMFKNFGLSLFLLQSERIGSIKKPLSKAMYAASYLVTMTMAGAFVNQFRQVSQGKDPIDMTNPETAAKFWAQSFLLGGGTGIVGDFLFSERDRNDRTFAEQLAGPVAGFAQDQLGLTFGNIAEAAKGEETKAAPEAVRFAKKYLPLANVFYIRLAFDRLIYNQIMQEIDPNFEKTISRNQRDMMKQYNQEYWWKPGDISPERAPDLSKTIETVAE